jgi:WhiB family transcriptional regulator, redox-sensing transcriptional regulator
VSSTIASHEVARYFKETTPFALRDRSRLSGPDLGFADTRELAWQGAALCAETDPEAFFPEAGQPARAAKRVCDACPVRAECLEYAVANGVMFGIWGGLTERERRPLGAQHLDLPVARAGGLAA